MSRTRTEISRWLFLPALILLGPGWALAQAPQQPAQPQPAQPQQPEPVPIGNLSIPNGSLKEVVDQLARALKINVILDPKLAGTVSIQTYGEVRNLDARNLLELILRINGFGMVQDGDIFRIVQMRDVLKQPIPFSRLNGNEIPEDDQIMLNLIFLKYVTVDELTKVIDPFTGDNAVTLAYPPANLLFVLDSRRNLKRLMSLISMFDSDMFANERVRLFELKNARPSDMQKDLESVLKSISLDQKNSTIKFLAVDRINTLIVVAPNPGVFDTVADWIKKLDVPVTSTAGAIDNYVYKVRYGRADCLSIALSALFGLPSSGGYGGFTGGIPAGVNPFGAYAPVGAGYGGAYPGAYPGAYGGAYGGAFGGAYGGIGGFGSGGYGAPNNFNSAFGGAGACSGGSFFGGYGGYGGPGAYGAPAFGGYSAQTPLMSTAAPGAAQAAAGSAPAAAAAPGPGGAASQPAPPRIVANPLNNSLLIQADPQQYQGILKMLKELDVPPRQILLEAKIYEVDLTDQFASGIQYSYTPRTGADLRGKFNFNNAATYAGTGLLTIGAVVEHGRELMAALALNENASHVHMISEPSLIATDSIPAAINVGTQVPVSTGSTTLPSAGGVAVTQQISAQDTGVTLQVNARVNPSGVVTLIVDQQISGVSSSVQSTVGGGTPAFDQQIVQTQITLQDGDTVAIGGTIKDSVTSQSNGLPGLSRVPILGSLFGSKSRTHTRSELIIFMTPHVIYDETNLVEASDELVGRVKKLRKYLKE